MTEIIRLLTATPSAEYLARLNRDPQTVEEAVDNLAAIVYARQRVERLATSDDLDAEGREVAAQALAELDAQQSRSLARIELEIFRQRSTMPGWVEAEGRADEGGVN